MADLVIKTPRGLYCPQGDFYIDPSAGVDRAVITHCHTDHCRPSSKLYITSKNSAELARIRVGQKPHIIPIDFGKKMQIGETTVSLHPAGHILGSSQVRIEYKGEVWVVSGDYKTESDQTCEEFEPVICHTFITESTFAHPRYNWRDHKSIFNLMNDWCQMNAMWGRVSILYGYSLGKAQRLLAAIDPEIAPILVHPAVERFNDAYRRANISFPKYEILSAITLASVRDKSPIIIMPPTRKEEDWHLQLGDHQRAFASGWMSANGKHSMNYDAGFPLSDHADWNGLLSAIDLTDAENIITMHGFADTLAAHLRSIGKNAVSWD